MNFMTYYKRGGTLLYLDGFIGTSSVVPALQELKNVASEQQPILTCVWYSQVHRM